MGEIVAESMSLDVARPAANEDIKNLRFSGTEGAEEEKSKNWVELLNF